MDFVSVFSRVPERQSRKVHHCCKVSQRQAFVDLAQTLGILVTLFQILNLLLSLAVTGGNVTGVPLDLFLSKSCRGHEVSIYPKKGCCTWKYGRELAHLHEPENGRKRGYPPS
jgi:hypothetical protein